MVLGVNVLMIVKLKDFEGPLDLLLHLIREHKMEIKTVRLADVTAQYLEFMGQLDTLDLNEAAEFIEIAATLIEIKSRGILPKPVVEEDPEDAEVKLLRQLEEYKLLKEASEKLKTIENVDRLYKDAAEFRPEYQYNLQNLSLDMLAQAFSRIMHRIQANATAIVDRKVRLDRFTVKDKIRDIRARVQNNGNLMFFELFDADFTKGEMVNTFLALLELLKSGEIKAVQENAFADIKIMAKIA